MRLKGYTLEIGLKGYTGGAISRTHRGLQAVRMAHGDGNIEK